VLRQTALFPFRRHGGFQEKQDSQGRRKPNRNNAESQTATAPKAKLQQRRKPNCNRAKQQKSQHPLACARNCAPSGGTQPTGRYKKSAGRPGVGGRPGRGERQGPPRLGRLPSTVPSEKRLLDSRRSGQPPLKPPKSGACRPKIGTDLKPPKSGAWGGCLERPRARSPRASGVWGQKTKAPPNARGRPRERTLKPPKSGACRPKIGARGALSRRLRLRSAVPPKFFAREFSLEQRPKRQRRGAVGRKYSGKKRDGGGTSLALSLCLLSVPPNGAREFSLEQRPKKQKRGAVGRKYSGACKPKAMAPRPSRIFDRVRGKTRAPALGQKYSGG
jgi:hypothetical protein